MTSFGILMPSIRPPKTVPLGDSRTIQVRARREQDLEILRDEYMGDELGPIMVTPEFDYNFRAYCTPEAFGRAMFQLSVEIDYEKFKPTTDRYNDWELHSVYNKIWGVMLDLNGAWGNFDWKASNAAQAGNVLHIPVPPKTSTTGGTTTSIKPLGTSGYTVVAGPPKSDSKPKGYVWDQKPKGEVAAQGEVTVQGEVVPQGSPPTVPALPTGPALLRLLADAQERKVRS